MMRILSFATYPVGVPRHGGQIRVAAIHQTLRQQGHQVRHIAAHHPSWYGATEAPQPYDIVFDDVFMQTLNRNNWRSDVHASAFVRPGGEVAERLARDLEEFDPDVVMFEQPWLWPALKPILARSDTDPLIVYSSQNVEAALIADLLGDFSPDQAAKIVAETEAIEMDLAREADLVLTVSESDAEHFRGVAKRVAVAGNGVWPSAAPGGLDYWRQQLARRSTAVFIGSAHGPNMLGFEKMLGYDLSFLKPDQMIVAVGGVSSMLERQFGRVVMGGIAWARTLIAGPQNPGGLSAITSLANVFLLPITEGGGTNLKTAEALYSRKPILATSFAFRGYEAFSQFPNVRIHDDPVEFRAALSQMLSGKAVSRAHTWEELEQLENLLWSETLRAIPRTLGVMHAQRSQALEAGGRTRVKAHRKGGVDLVAAIHSGWHSVDGDGSIWSGDTPAVLRIPVDPAKKHWLVRIRFRLMPDHDGANEVRFHTASGLKHRQPLKTLEYVETEFSCITADVLGSYLEIVVETDSLTSPQSLELSVDSRNLGVNISELIIDEGTVASAGKTPVGKPQPGASPAKKSASRKIFAGLQKTLR